MTGSSPFALLKTPQRNLDVTRRCRHSLECAPRSDPKSHTGSTPWPTIASCHCLAKAKVCGGRTRYAGPMCFKLIQTELDSFISCTASCSAWRSPNRRLGDTLLCTPSAFALNSLLQLCKQTHQRRSAPTGACSTTNPDPDSNNLNNNRQKILVRLVAQKTNT